MFVVVAEGKTPACRLAAGWEGRITGKTVWALVKSTKVYDNVLSCVATFDLKEQLGLGPE